MPKENSRVIVGTSGYSFDDWEGVFYPPGLPKGKRLDFYKDHFKAAEINSTYYRIPHPAVFHNMVKKVGDDFEFIIKTHRSFTHDRKEIEEPTREYIGAIRPVVDAGLMKGYIAQFPSSFRYSPANLQYVIAGGELFKQAPLFVEFRHNSWDRPEVYESLRANAIGFCCVDEPQIQGLFPPKAEATTDIGYVRLHGRHAYLDDDLSEVPDSLGVQLLIALDVESLLGRRAEEGAAAPDHDPLLPRTGDRPHRVFLGRLPGSQL